MPDHVHVALIPYSRVRLPTILQRLKSVSSHRLKRGVVWQDESFDRIMRSTENLRQKCEYICNNPVCAGLVARVDDYRWTWREWIEGQAGRLSSTTQR
jgi:putative transposase